jgi:hypothetical protein
LRRPVDRIRLLLTAVAVALLAGCGGIASSGRGAVSEAVRPQASTAVAKLPTPTGSPHAAACVARPALADVYHPHRLRVIRRCATVTGTVAFVRREPDGDWHVNLRLPASEKALLDAANDRYEQGELVLEIVPADQAGCGPVGAPAKIPPTAYRGPSYDYGTCSGLDLTPPAVGAEVQVAGPYVLDTDHGWREIHAVERIEVLG